MTKCPKCSKWKRNMRLLAAHLKADHGDKSAARATLARTRVVVPEPTSAREKLAREHARRRRRAALSSADRMMKRLKAESRRLRARIAAIERVTRQYGRVDLEARTLL